MPTLYKPFIGNYPITSGYGNRKDPISGKSTFHNGIDFGVPANTPLYNLEDGVVTVAGVIDNFNPKSPNLGVGVKADSDGVVAVYMHMNRVDVKVGQRLKGGDTIGLSGNTGYSTGPHLHFGLYSKLWNSTINPTFLLNQWTEVGGNSTNNNNMSNLESQKTLARSFLETPEIQGLSFNDGNTFGYLRQRIDLPVEQDGQRPYEALKQFGMKALEMETNLTSQRANLESQVQTLNVENTNLKNTNQTLQNQIQDVRADLVEVTNENNQLKDQLANQKPEVSNALYIDQIEDLENKLSDLNTENNQLQKQIALLDNGKFSLDKLITGIVSGKNYLTNFSFVSFLTGLSAYLSSLTTVANPEIASGLTFATGTIAMVLIFIKNKKPTEAKKIQL